MKRISCIKFITLLTMFKIFSAIRYLEASTLKNQLFLIEAGSRFFSKCPGSGYYLPRSPILQNSCLFNNLNILHHLPCSTALPGKNVTTSFRSFSEHVKSKAYVFEPMHWLKLQWRLYNLKKWDPHFSIEEFISGSKQALETITSLCAKRDFKGMKGLVDETLIKELKFASATWSFQTVQDTVLNNEDLVLASPRKVRMSEVTSARKYCAIDMMYISIKRPFIEKREKKTILNSTIVIIMARFIRDYSAGATPDWTVARLRIRHEEADKRIVLKRY